MRRRKLNPRKRKVARANSYQFKLQDTYITVCLITETGRRVSWMSSLSSNNNLLSRRNLYGLSVLSLSLIILVESILPQRCVLHRQTQTDRQTDTHTLIDSDLSHGQKMKRMTPDCPKIAIGRNWGGQMTTCPCLLRACEFEDAILFDACKVVLSYLIVFRFLTLP